MRREWSDHWRFTFSGERYFSFDGVRDCQIQLKIENHTEAYFLQLIRSHCEMLNRRHRRDSSIQVTRMDCVEPSVGKKQNYQRVIDWRCLPCSSAADSHWHFNGQGPSHRLVFQKRPENEKLLELETLALSRADLTNIFVDPE